MDIKMLKRSICNVAECNSGNFLLEETDPHATLKQVNLCDIPTGSLIIKMEATRFSNLLKDNKTWGFNKHSDYLIVTDNDMVFIEMKSLKEVNQTLIETCRQKFASDNCTIYYADKIFEELLSKNAFFKQRCPHYVLLYQGPSVIKDPIECVKELPNNTPCTFRRIAIYNGSTLSFNRTI